MEIKSQNGERRIVPSHQCVCMSQLVTHFQGLGLTCPLFLLCPVLWGANFPTGAADHDWPQIHSVWPHFLPSGLWVMLWVGPHGNVLSTHSWVTADVHGENLCPGVWVAVEGCWPPTSPFWLLLRHLSDSDSVVSLDSTSRRLEAWPPPDTVLSSFLFLHQFPPPPLPLLRLHSPESVHSGLCFTLCSLWPPNPFVQELVLVLIF